MWSRGCSFRNSALGRGCSQPPFPGFVPGSETYPGKKEGIRRRQLNLFLCFFFLFFFFVWSLWDFSFCVTTVVSWAENWKYNVKAHKFNIRWKGCRMNKYIRLPGNILLTSLHPDQALLSQACKLLQEALFQEISLPFGCPGPLGTAK